MGNRGGRGTKDAHLRHFRSVGFDKDGMWKGGGQHAACGEFI